MERTYIASLDRSDTPIYYRSSTLAGVLSYWATYWATELLAAFPSQISQNNPVLRRRGNKRGRVALTKAQLTGWSCYLWPGAAPLYLMSPTFLQFFSSHCTRDIYWQGCFSSPTSGAKSFRTVLVRFPAYRPIYKLYVKAEGVTWDLHHAILSEEEGKLGFPLAGDQRIWESSLEFKIKVLVAFIK